MWLELFKEFLVIVLYSFQFFRAILKYTNKTLYWSNPCRLFFIFWLKCCASIKSGAVLMFKGDIFISCPFHSFSLGEFLIFS